MLPGALADKHGRVVGGIQTFEPNVPGRTGQMRADEWDKIRSDSMLVDKREGRKLYVTSDGRLFILATDNKGMEWVIDVCKWIPWICGSAVR